MLENRTPITEDKETLEQVIGILQPIQINLLKIVEKLPKRVSNRQMQNRARRQAALEKTSELKKTVDGWDQDDIGQCCNEFIRGCLISNLLNLIK